MGEGRYASISEIAAPEKIERGYFGAVPTLTPELVEAILNGRQPEGLMPSALLEGGGARVGGITQPNSQPSP